MKLRRLSLKWQAVLILAGALLISHVIGVLVYYFDRRDLTLNLETLDLTERVLGYVTIALPQEPDEQRRILEAARSRFLDVTFEEDLPDGPCDDSELDQTIKSLIRDTLPASLDWQVCIMPPHLADRRFVASPPRNGGYASVLHIAIRFASGDTVSFHGMVSESPSFFTDSALLYILFAAAMIGGAAYWIIQRVTLPLQRFGEKATEIGRNLDAPPLSEEGPSEVVAASRAFNRMQERLKRLIGRRTEMLAAISHDLKTPITRLRLRIEMMADAGEQDKLLNVLDEMEAMVNAVLEFIRGSAPREQQRVVDLSALVESLCDDLIEARAPVIFSGKPGPIRFPCRPQALRRAVQNLIDNAVKYAGGAEVRVEEHPTVIEIEVLDRGPGIPEAQLDKVLQPFYRMEGSRSRVSGGHGLGLSIAATVAHAHGGNIRIANRPGGGLQVSLILPK